MAVRLAVNCELFLGFFVSSCHGPEVVTSIPCLEHQTRLVAEDLHQTKQIPQQILISAVLVFRLIIVTLVHDYPSLCNLHTFDFVLYYNNFRGIIIISQPNDISHTLAHSLE